MILDFDTNENQVYKYVFFPGGGWLKTKANGCDLLCKMLESMLIADQWKEIDEMIEKMEEYF